MVNSQIAQWLGTILTIIGVGFLLLGFYGGSTELMIYGAVIILGGLVIAVMLPQRLRRQP